MSNIRKNIMNSSVVKNAKKAGKTTTKKTPPKSLVNPMKAYKNNNFFK